MNVSYKILQEKDLNKPITMPAADSFVLTIDPFTLKFQKEYTLEVTVSNNLIAETRPETQTINFTTGV